MALNIEQLRAAFAKKSESTGEGNTGFWDKFYPFYKMDFDQTVRFRFLPDKDEENPLGFIVENKYHELLINGQKKRIACLKMYGESCPCCEHSSQYYNNGDEKMGKSFWRKIDYIAQGIIVSSPFDYPIAEGDNPVRLISISSKLYKTIEAKIVKGDLDTDPTDPVNGFDFMIMKTKQGEYADYSTSDFARRSTSVPDEVLARLDLYDLKNYRYGKIERPQMEAMIEAFLTGKSYETSKEQQKPADHQTGNSGLDEKLNETKPTSSVASMLKAVTESGAKTEEKPAEEHAVSTASSGKATSPAEIMARIRARQQNNAG